MKDENVLVIPTAFFHQLGHFQGFTRDVEAYIPQILEPEVVSFQSRRTVEEDPCFKQLIPYMLFRWVSPEGKTHIFRYTRGKGMGEGRLHLKHSVGVGGHLSDIDCANAPDNNTVYETGMKRERAEEVRVETKILDERIVGLINDDLEPVGRVHLGVVHLIDVAEPKVYPNEEDVLETGFYPIEELLQNLTGYESWSSITLEALWK